MNLSVLKMKFTKARRIGAKAVMLCYLERAYYSFLRIIFHFDSWHTRGTWHCRPYKAVAVELVHSVKPKTVVEIGCGLGEIISRISAKNRVGYDIDSGAIRAASFLRGSRTTFRVGSGEDVIEQTIDVLIAINWIHNLSPEQLELLLVPLLPHVNCILLESIDTDEVGYKYHHDFKFLQGVTEIIASRKGGATEPRTIHLFKVVKQ